MAKRPHISVILVFQGQSLRADFAKSFATPTRLIREPLDAEATLVDAVELVTESHPKLGPRVLVLATEIWSQLISLPRLSIGGIEADELESALRFEAETLSGIEIDDISLAYQAVGTAGEFDQFWVNVIRKSELDAINAMLESHGCREIGLAHPVGFYGSRNEKLDGTSVEVWRDLVYLLSHNGTQLSRVKQRGADIDRHCSRLIIGSRSGSDSNLPSAREVIDLAESESLTRWMSRVAANYGDRFDQLVSPVLRKSKLRRGTPVRHLVSGLLAFAVLVFCFWHYNFMQERNAELTQRIADIKEPAAAKKRYDAQIVTVLEQKSDLEAESETLQEELAKIQFFLTEQDDRIAKLLRLLIELRKPDLFIQRIDGTEDGLSISGISLSGESAQALAKRLRIQALPLGWKVNPARQKGQEKMTTGGPWNFTILLTDVGPPTTTGG